MTRSSTLRVICWQPVLTEHQLATFAALAACPDVTLTVVTSRADNRDRPGWFAGSGDLDIRPLPRRGWIGRIRTLMAEKDVVHVFGSPFDHSRQTVALLLALARGKAVFLISEPYAGAAFGYFNDRHSWLTRIKHRVRPWLYKAYGLLLASRLTGVFAISPRAVRQFRAMGVPADRVLPFGYFVPAQKNAPVPAREADGSLRCVYVGSLIRRKGVDTMLAAWTRSTLLRERATLDIHGPGTIDAALPKGVRRCGPLPYGTAGATMAAADIVIVPSLADGWAAVVNEAILAGTPVVVGDAAGAAAMIGAWQCGRVFPSGDAAALAAALEGLASDAAELATCRAATTDLAAVLDPRIAGRFMRDGIVALVRGTARPVAPWYPDPD